MSQLTPYLTFAGQAREAMEFYAEVFDGQVEILTVGQYGDTSAPGAQQVLHATLVTPAGFVLHGADATPGEQVAVGDAVSVCLSGLEREELRGYFHALADGAEIRVDLAGGPDGDEYGHLVDRYGIGWVVVITGTPAA